MRLNVPTASAEAMQDMHCFFGTANGQSQLTLQGLAEEEDLEFDEDVLEFWQAYVEKGRCAMRPVWRGLTFRVPMPGLMTDGNGEGITTASLGRGPLDDGNTPDSSIWVEAIFGQGGKPLNAAIVGPATRLEGESSRTAAPAA